MPERIQRRRTKGWRMPENTVYVGRPTKWRNPFGVHDGFVYRVGALTAMARDNATAVLLYTSGLRRGGYSLRYGDNDWREQVMPVDSDEFSELRGKDLACWCPLDQPCHADVLLAIANGEASDG